MAANVIEELSELMDKDTWSGEDHQRLLELLSRTPNAPQRFRSMVSQMQQQIDEPRGTAAVKLGIARYVLCQFESALEVLSDGTDNKDRRWFQGLCLKALHQYDRAIEEFQRSSDRGGDGDQAELQIAECLALSGRGEEAGKRLDGLKKLSETPEYLYIQGLIADQQNRTHEAAEFYRRVLDAEPEHPRAMFRLAYYLDLHGEEDQALDLYRQCTAHPPVHAHALMNMAVLHEDAGRYDQAIDCLQRVLATNPAHERARLFLKDIESSKTMYYDEDQARRIARRNAVLDIPVTDFELSVRARNCLKKMNINTLGDLVMTTEADLLGYKNFGETSLKEIKDMLTAKGLHLGQGLEESQDFYRPGEAPASSSGSGNVANEGILSTPVSQIDFSIRARKALEGLDIETLGDLANRTEAELMACKNFGQTSLNEVRQRLTEYGLRLREVH
jgi:DNA-directed RNA polymerase subunit alpha